MTAAYTNDPITQEQNLEKKTSTVVNETVKNKKEQGISEESNEFTSTEMMKVATGGQDQEEIAVNQERLTLYPPIDTSALLEQKEEEKIENQKRIEDSEFSEKNKTTSIRNNDNQDTSSDSDVTKSEVLNNCESSTTSQLASNSIVSMRVDAFLAECDSQDSIYGTRGTDSLPKDNFKLQELRDCVESIATGTSNLSNDLETHNGSLDSVIIRNDIEEVYDPESKLNFHEAVRAGDAKSITALLASNSVQNLDEPDWNVSGDPPLLVAATNHCLPVLR